MFIFTIRDRYKQLLNLFIYSKASLSRHILVQVIILARGKRGDLTGVAPDCDQTDAWDTRGQASMTVRCTCAV